MNVKGPPKLVPSANYLAIAQRNQEQSPLLRLPAELRTRVYDYVLDSKTASILHDDCNGWDRLEFSRTSHKIFSETAHNYFRSRMLPLSTKKGVSCPTLRRLETVLSKLTPSQKRCVNTIVLHGDAFTKVFDLNLPNLSKVCMALPNLQIFGFQVKAAPIFNLLIDDGPEIEDCMNQEMRPYTNALGKIYGPEHLPFEL